MLGLSANKPSFFGDEIILRSIDWLENFPWEQDVNSIEVHEDKHEICLNVKGFSPGEIIINTCDGLLVIEAKHDEKKDDYGYVSRHFVRKYRLPEDCQIEEVVSTLSPEGVLVVSTPRKVVKQNTIIPVTNIQRKCFSKL